MKIVMTSTKTKRDDREVHRDRADPVALLALEVQPAAWAVGNHREPAREQLSAPAARAAPRRAPPQHAAARRAAASCHERVRGSVVRDPHGRAFPCVDRHVGQHVGVARVHRARDGRRRSARVTMPSAGVPSRSNETEVASTVSLAFDEPGRRACGGSASTSACDLRTVNGSLGRTRRPDSDRVLGDVPAQRRGEAVRVGIGAEHVDHRARWRGSDSCSPGRRRSRVRR